MDPNQQYYDPSAPYEPSGYDDNGNPYYYDQNGVPYYIDANGQSHYYDEQPAGQSYGEPAGYDDSGNPYYYDQNGTPYYVDASGQSHYYDEQPAGQSYGEPAGYDDSGNPYYYDQNGTPYYVDASGQSHYYDEPVQNYGGSAQAPEQGGFDQQGSGYNGYNGQPIAGGYAAQPGNKVLVLNRVCYSYDGKKFVLKDLSIEFEQGKIYAIIGKSGAGKTTLLSLLAGLDKTTSGQILVNGKDISKINKYSYRSNEVGVVFQSYNLLPKYTAVENVELSMDISKLSYKKKRDQAKALLSQVGLTEDEMKRRVLRLSGGQQQRVAIARALSFSPNIILADEPTGNLDPDTQDEIMAIFTDLAHRENKCVVIVTHSQIVAQKADIVHELIPNTEGEEQK